MSEEKPGLAEQMAREDWRRIGAGLAKSLEGITAELDRSVKRSKETREAAALFALYRQRRAADGPRSPDRDRREELDAMLAGALEGYDTAMLSDLIVFGEWLSTAGKPIWMSRAR